MRNSEELGRVKEQANQAFRSMVREWSIGGLCVALDSSGARGALRAGSNWGLEWYRKLLEVNAIGAFL